MALKNRNPIKLKSWRELKKHHVKMALFNLKKELKNQQRKSNFSFRMNQFSVDFSKNLINKDTLDLLVKLAEEAELKSAIEKQFSGDIINSTEQRAVLHTALRDFSNNSILVDGKDVKPEIKASLSKIKDFSSKVISGEA